MEGIPEKTFKSSAVMTSFALSTANPALSQTLDGWESAFSFPLSAKRGFFKMGVVISSTKVAEEAVFIVSVLGIARVTGGPFLTMRTVLFPILDSGLFFFDLIFTYMSWLNLVIISAQRKHLLKK